MALSHRKKRNGKKAAVLDETYAVLLKTYGPQKCFLHHMTPFQLLVATILSAQCTDKMVNRVTEPLFKQYPEPGDFAAMEVEQLEKLIHSCGYYRAKAKNIIAASRAVEERFHSRLPDTMEDLLSLPGVGRKTANVVLADSFGVPGLPVDTHVKRIMNLMGVVKTDDPEKIEAELCAALEPEKWGAFSHLVIVHGRTRCPAGRPDCAGCEVRHLCAHGRKQTEAPKCR